MSKTTKHTGSCHCGNVKFEVRIDASRGSRCNCSICTKTSQLGSVVKPAAFELQTPKAELSFYEWGTKMGRRYFCKTCGIHVFGAGHLEQLGGDFVSVNLNTLDDIDTSEVEVTHWDGRNDNWQAGDRPAPWPMKKADGPRPPRTQHATA